MMRANKVKHNTSAIEDKTFLTIHMLMCHLTIELPHRFCLRWHAGKYTNHSGIRLRDVGKVWFKPEHKHIHTLFFIFSELYALISMNIIQEGKTSNIHGKKNSAVDEVQVFFLSLNIIFIFISMKFQHLHWIASKFNLFSLTGLWPC